MKQKEESRPKLNQTLRDLIDEFFESFTQISIDRMLQSCESKELFDLTIENLQTAINTPHKEFYPLICDLEHSENEGDVVTFKTLNFLSQYCSGIFEEAPNKNWRQVSDLKDEEFSFEVAKYYQQKSNEYLAKRSKTIELKSDNPSVQVSAIGISQLEDGEKKQQSASQ